MPVKVQIDGVGTVELDDDFSSLDPKDQEAVIAQIVSQSKGSRTAPAQAPEPQMQEPAPQFDPSAGIDPETAPKLEYDQQWYDHQEKDYQAALKHASGADPAGQPPAPQSGERMNDFASFGLGFGDSLSFGFGDEILGGIGALTGGGDYKTVWKDGWKEAYNNNVEVNRANLKLAQEEDPWLFLGGGLASAAVPFGAAGSVLRGGTALSNTVKAAREAEKISQLGRVAKAGATGAAYGGLYGLGTGEDTLSDRLNKAGEFALYGAAGGVVGDQLIQTAAKATPAARNARFARNQAENNPFAAFDAEVVQDIAASTRDRAVSKTDPKGRAVVTAKTLNSIEQRYFAEFKNGINKLDIPEADKLKLKAGLSGKYSLGNDEIDALRQMGVPGQAVADAVVKTQRLRALTPELKGKVGLLSRAADVTDFVPGIPGIVGRGLRAAGRASGDGEAARVNAAEKLLKKESAYNKLGEMVGPSGARESQKAFWDAVEATAAAREQELVRGEVDKIMNPTVTRADKIEFRSVLDSGELDPRDIASLDAANRRKKANRAAEKLAGTADDRLAAFDQQLTQPPPAPAEPKITAADRRNLRQQITDPVPDTREATLPEITDKEFIKRTQARNSGLAKMEGSMADWEAKLADPSTAPQPKAPKQAAPDTVDGMVQRGIEGEYRALDSLSNSTGLNRDDAKRVLQSIKEENPELARDVDRLMAGHNTSNPRSGPIFRPLMQAKMKELGIEPMAPASAKSIPIDEAAQARLSNIEPATLKEFDVNPAQVTAREADLLEELDKVDPIRAYLSDGSYARDSAIPEMQRPDDMARADAIRSELKAIKEERDMRSIQRPQQWNDGKNRYQSQANASIDRMLQDGSVSQAGMDAIGNAPVQIRDNFKTTEEAESFIVGRVIPDLEAARVPTSEINRIRSYLFEIAQAKPYATRQAYEDGTRYRGPGRPSEAE